jgi:hypothetical protein
MRRRGWLAAYACGALACHADPHASVSTSRIQSLAASIATALPASTATTKAAAATPPQTEASADPWPSAERLALAFPAAQAGDRIFSKSRHLWIRPRPGARSWIGYLSLGDSVRVRGGQKEGAYAGPGDGSECQSWYAVEPTGFACVGTDATFDAADAEVVELVRTKADVSSPWPYRYAESRGVPVLDALPNQGTEPAQFRPDAGRVPPLFMLGPGGRTLVHRVANGSTIAYTDEFAWGGRSYLLSWDRGIIDKSKVEPYPLSQFHGVALGRVALPIAFFRQDGGGEKWSRRGDGSFAASGQRWPRLSWVALTGVDETVGRARFLETREGYWCRANDAAVARRADTPAALRKHGGRKTWVDVSVLGGTLVAYEDATPVYATLISPGRGGIPTPGIPTIETAATPLGHFHVLGKFATATMVSSSVSTLIHTEVQYTQNFEGPYALHGAYWHDRWGEKKSGGCVNLSPIDSRRVFAWTDPPLPEGWHGLRSIDFPGERTLISIHR